MNLLNETEVKALHEALNDEYRAFETYEQVIADFGEVRPFTNIRNAEARHINALCRLFAHYHLPIPENKWVGEVERYSSVYDACKDGVAAEISNGQMYDRLLTFSRTIFGEVPVSLSVIGSSAAMILCVRLRLSHSKYFCR